VGDKERGKTVGRKRRERERGMEGKHKLERRNIDKEISTVGK